MTGVLRSRRAAMLVATMVVGASALAGCAESGGSGSTGGEGVDAGASKADYQKAFEDIDPITLLTQTPAPKGSVTGLPQEEYYKAVEDWSGGKIKFDISYSNAVAEPAEADDALNDGRLDIGSVLPIYDPSEYPANATLIEGGFISDQSAINGVLSSNAWPNQVAFESDEIMKEFDEHGLVPLVPVYNSGANALFCSKPRTDLASLKGTSVGSGGQAQSAQVKALGGSPSSIPYTELYESLQRGVVDCTVSSPTVAVLGGFVDSAPNVTVDPAAGFALAPGALVFSKTTWEGLPLVAQQLLWDRLDIFVKANIESKIFVNNAAMAEAVAKAGGQIAPFDEDARTVLQDENDKLLAGLAKSDAFSDGEAFVTSMQDANTAWQEKVAGFGLDDVSYADFGTWWAENKDSVDMSAYTTAVTEDILAAHRPS
ncbi:TRAP transporter substrate-binding protein DctP [Nocardioides sp. SLBN-35]|uniref:TRAP transporter substrate-binding protein DctP n=1 Tax=Nocardioides sp. SLBN-35 TaxID=2768445 RepID=UPI001154DBED|nr:TRAP transporter substrate-binding protein DctP [Nocardioides sp. SLBN-35]TQK69499.1 TRAP-type C4-dicarboxylate transport system substrate-binding protein [Nocardioides sp. SLBN-35]